MAAYTTRGKVKIFPQKGGWVYIPVPKRYTEKLKNKMHWGLVPITATTGKTKWKTSLLPMGDGTHFIALSKTVRKKEHMEVGNTISISFSPRKS